jgi:hypothetical protein
VQIIPKFKPLPYLITISLDTTIPINKFGITGIGEKDSLIVSTIYELDLALSMIGHKPHNYIRTLLISAIAKKNITLTRNL